MSETNPALSARGLTVRYGQRVAVDGLSLELARGEIVAMLGPNGAGKSTTLLALAGALTPSAGEIFVDGAAVAGNPAARRRLGLADQPPLLYDFFTVAEHVAFVAEARGDRDPAGQAALLEALGMASLASRPCRELSFGMRQRVGLAAALVGGVDVVLLDETLNGLDPHAARSARAVLEAAAARGAAILLSTHLLGVAERLCQRIVVMDRGRIVADKRGAELTALLAHGAGAVEELYVSVVGPPEAA